MAPRLNTKQTDQTRSCYVYRIFDGPVTVYIGKGSGSRLSAQKHKFGLSGEIIERCKSDDHAFQRERYWIATLQPTDNKHPGGNGKRTLPKPLTPLQRAAKRGGLKFEREYQSIGPRRYAAQILTSKLYEGNIATYGVSKLDLDRMRAVANGPWC